MERAILETLKFFGRSMKIYEIHKWLIGKKAQLRTVEKEVKKMHKRGRIKIKDGWCSLGKVDGMGLEEDIDLIRWQTLFYQLDPRTRLVMLDPRGLVVIRQEDPLKVGDKNLRNAYQLLSMKLLYQRDSFYHNFLNENSWVFKYFPNWTTSVLAPLGTGRS